MSAHQLTEHSYPTGRDLGRCYCAKAETKQSDSLVLVTHLSCQQSVVEQTSTEDV